MIHGQNHRGLDIDLSTGKTEDFHISAALLKRWIGGRGLGTHFLFREMKQGVDPLSAESVMVISPGALAGSRSPSSGRFSVTYRSPLTGTIASSNSGGFWGVALKRAGYDTCIVRGRAAVPVYVLIEPDRVEVRECGDLWGRNVPELNREMKSRFSPAHRVLSIGRAGENRVLYASLMNDSHHAVGRGGPGAVWGAKNLKALVVSGRKTFPPAQPKAYENALYQANKLVNNFPVTSRALPRLGTPGLLKIVYYHDMLPRRNFTSVKHDPGDIEKISGENLNRELFRRPRGCYNCRVRCVRETRAGGREGSGPEYETLAVMGANLDIYDIDTIARAGYICNENGMDTISFGGTVALAMELREKGILDLADTGKVDIRFGAADILEDLAGKTVDREGPGDFLARGSLRIARYHGVEDLAMEVKGLELPGYDPRASLLQALGYATSPRGGCHLKGGYMISLGFFGGAREVGRFLVDTAAGHCVDVQDSGCVDDMLGVCRFLSFSISENELSRIYSAFTGVDVTAGSLKWKAARVQNEERRYNNREGFGRKDDRLPLRMYREKIQVEGEDRAIDPGEQFDPLLCKYYKIRNWTPDGRPVSREEDEERKCP